MAIFISTLKKKIYIYIYIYIIHTLKRKKQNLFHTQFPDNYADLGQHMYKAHSHLKHNSSFLHDELRVTHSMITVFNLITLLCVFVIAGTGLPIYGSYFFHTTLPIDLFHVPTVQLHNYDIFAYLLIFSSFDALLAVFFEKVQLALALASPAELEAYALRKFGLHVTGYAIKMASKALDTAVSWMRYVNIIIFIRAQLSFALAIVIPDVVVRTLVTQFAYHQRHRVIFEVWRRYIPAVLAVQLVFVVFYPLNLFFCGADRLDFFTPGKPVSAFGLMVREHDTYTFVVFLVFFVQVVESISKINIDAFFFNVLYNGTDSSMAMQNPAARADKPLPGASTSKSKEAFERDIRTAVIIAEAVSLVRGVLSWINYVFIVNFVFESYFLIVVYILADTLVTLVSLHFTLVEADAPPRIRGINIITTTKTVLILMVQMLLSFFIIFGVFQVHGVDSSTFMKWSDGVFFDVPIDNQLRRNLLYMLCVFVQVASTFYDSIIYPDYYHYTTHVPQQNFNVLDGDGEDNDNNSSSDEDEHDANDIMNRDAQLDAYGKALLRKRVPSAKQHDKFMMIMVHLISRLTYFVCKVFVLNLIANGSIKYVVIFAGVNVPLAGIILGYYLVKKKNIMIDEINLNAIKDARVKEQLKNVMMNRKKQTWINK